MSEKRFNLKNYVKINGDIPIGSRLMEEHGNVPDELTEKQLDKDRVPEENVTIEKLLEKSRLGGADVLTEGRLNTETSNLSKYRNPSAYEGDINKVEEQRLAGKPVEDEKYLDSSETPKKLRWWEEGGESPDGLKLANKKKEIKIAQLKNEDFFDEDEDFFKEDDKEKELSFDNSWERVPEIWSEEEGILPEKQNPLLGDLDEFDIVDKDIGAEGFMKIKEQKNLSIPIKGVPIKGVRMVLTYDPEAFNGDETAIKKAAFDTVIEARPELYDAIDTEDFYDIDESGDEGTIVLKAFGDKFDTLDKNKNNTPLFTEIGFTQDDSSGTMISSGAVKVSDSVNKDNVIRDTLDFINDLHPRLNITEESLDLSKLNDGVISFLKSPKPVEDFAIDEVPVEELESEVPVEELEAAEGVFAQSNYEIKTNVKKN